LKKVLVVTPYFPPYPRVGTIRRVENFVRYLPANHWKPVVLTMDWGYGDPGVYDNTNIYVTRNIARFSSKAYYMVNMETATTWKTTVASAAVRLLRQIKHFILIPDELILWSFGAISACRRIMRTESPDVIFVAAPPFSTLLIAVMLKKISNIPLVCDVRDDWIGNPLTQKTNLVLAFIERKMEKWVVDNSECVVLVTDASLEMWKERYFYAREKFSLVTNGYDEEEFASIQEYEFEGFAMLHAGSLETGRSPEVIFKALSLMGAKEKGVSFHQYGLTLREYKDMTFRHGVQDIVHFNKMVGGRESVARIKGCSILILIPTQNAPTAIPGKAYEYLRSGKPILLISRDNATTDFMKNFDNVYHIKPDDDKKCLEVIEKIYDEGYALIKRKPPDALLKKYDRKELTARLAGLFDSIGIKQK